MIVAHSWFPLIKKMCYGYFILNASNREMTSMLFFPRSTKSPIMRYLWFGGPPPHISNNDNKSWNYPCMSPINFMGASSSNNELSSLKICWLSFTSHLTHASQKLTIALLALITFFYLWVTISASITNSRAKSFYI